MRITGIKCYPVRMGARNQLLVKVETDDGIYGWGESGLSYREKAVMGMIEHYAHFLIGRNPSNIGALWQEMYRSQYFEGGRVISAAISALDVALHDIKGKALGVPVYELLGGSQRHLVPSFATTSAPPGPKMIEQVQMLSEAGWKCVRLLADGQDNETHFEPRESIATTAEWVTKTREAIGLEMVLGVEYHHRLNVAEAASFCQKLPKGTIDFLEEAIRDESPTSYQSLRRMTDVPFAIGEEFSSKWQFLPYIEHDILQFVRLDICNVGGFTEAMKVAGWSEAHYVDLMPHNPLGPICTAASVHLGAAVANFSWLECRSSPSETNMGLADPDVFPVQIEMKDADYIVPKAPGLGIEVNEELLKKVEFEYIDPPHLRRRDGSITNW